MGFSIPPGMTLEQMLKVMGGAEPKSAPAVEPDPDPAPAPAKSTRKRPAAPEPEN